MKWNYSHSTRRNRLTSLGLLCVLVATSCFTKPGRGIRNLAWEIISPIHRIEYVERDVDEAFQGGDFRFAGVYGADVSVSGIPNGAFDSLVTLHGILVNPYTTDSPVTRFGFRRQDYYNEYATQYNMLLLKRLMATPDGKTRNLLRQVESEVRLLRKSNPSRDAERDFNAGNPTFIHVQPLGAPGLPVGDPKGLEHRTGLRFLKGNPMWLNRRMRVELQEVVARYVVPYNARLYQLLPKYAAKHIAQ